MTTMRIRLSTILSLSNLTLPLLFLLLFSLLGCRSNSAEPSKALLDEADKLLNRETKLMDQWSRELNQIFSEQNRAQFPSNRDLLTNRAQKAITLLDESLRLSIEAAAKYDDATRVMRRDQDRKGWSLIASSLRKDIEIEQLFRTLAQVPSDRAINDSKKFNEKFAHFKDLIQQKQKEKDDLFEYGKRLLLRQ